MYKRQGDIRRAILKGRSLDDSCSVIATLNPIKVEAPVLPDAALRIMNAHDIDHLPAVDAAGRVQDLVLRQDLAVSGDHAWNERRLSAVIIAPEASISEAMAQLDKAATGVLLICDEVRHLLGLSLIHI